MPTHNVEAEVNINLLSDPLADRNWEHDLSSTNQMLPLRPGGLVRRSRQGPESQSVIICHE